MPERSLAVVAPWRWWAGFALVIAIAVYMTRLAYAGDLPSAFARIPQSDKAIHFTVTGMLAFFLDGALRRRMIFRGSAFPVPLGAVAILVPAGIEEYLQRYATLRTSSLWDFAADLAGVVVLVSLSRRLAQ
jgi:VanZ family protein